MHTLQIIHEDRRWTIHELAETTEYRYGVSQEFLTENLNMHCTAAKFVPQLLTNNQKQQHVNVSWATKEG
jgi:hypothetical protein